MSYLNKDTLIITKEEKGRTYEETNNSPTATNTCSITNTFDTSICRIGRACPNKYARSIPCNCELCPVTWVSGR